MSRSSKARSLSILLARATSADLETPGLLSSYESILSSITPSTTGVISILGPTASSPKTGTPVTDGTRLILRAIKESRPPSPSTPKKPRFVLTSTLSFPAPADDAPPSLWNYQSWISSFLVGAVYYGLRHAYNEVTGVGRLVREEGEGVDWTVVRIAILTNGEARGYKAGKKDEVGFFLTRKVSLFLPLPVEGVGPGPEEGTLTNLWCKDFARFLVEQVEVSGGPWEGRFPALASA